MQQLAMQDLSICSFPFGNTNGMLDCLRLGLPTFVLRGKEICSSSEYELLTECGLGNFIFENKTELKKSINKFLIDSDWRLHTQTHFKIKAAKYIAKNDIEQAIDYEASLFISWIKSTIEDYNNFALHADLEYQ